MNSKLFSFEEIRELYDGINFNIKNLIFLTVCCLVILITYFLKPIFFKYLNYYLFLLLISPIVLYFLTVLLKMSFKLIDGEELNFSDFLIPLSLFLKVSTSLIIYGFIIFIPAWLVFWFVFLNAISMGLSGVTMVDIFLGRGEGEYSLVGILLSLFIILLSLIFIFYALIKYMLAPFLIIDRQYSIISSFKKSAELTKGKKLKIFKCINIVSGLNFKKFFKIIIFYLLLIPIIAYFSFSFEFITLNLSVGFFYLILFTIILINSFVAFAFVYRYLIGKNE